MIERQGGRIITIISDAGRAGEAGLEVYSGAKAGAAGFTRAIARSLGRYQITANCVAIAATMTPAIEARLKANPEMAKKMMEKYVIRRPGQPTDVANMVLFLASDASAWITGQTYPVNGGFYLRALRQIDDKQQRAGGSHRTPRANPGRHDQSAGGEERLRSGGRARRLCGDGQARCRG